MVIVVAIHQPVGGHVGSGPSTRPWASRVTSGLIGYRLFRAADDAAEILVALDFDTVGHAEGWLAKADQTWLDKAGLTVYPPTFVGEPIEEGQYSGGRR